MMRLFLGLTLPEDIRARLAGLCGGVPGARWVTPENLHLTLRFIGETEEETAHDISAHMARVKELPFDLTCRGVGHFGSGRRIRSLWAGVDPSPPLMALQKKVEVSARRAGLPFALYTEGYRKTPISELYHTYIFDHFDQLPDLVARHGASVEA